MRTTEKHSSAFLVTITDFVNLALQTLEFTGENRKLNNLECFVLCSVYLAEAKTKSVSISRLSHGFCCCIPRHCLKFWYDREASLG